LPLACSNIEPLHGIVNGAALEFPPEDIDAMTKAMRRLCEDSALRQDLSEKGRERAAHFTWEETARRTLSAIEAGLRAEPSRRS
jgi:glycosyltransferase involved in cell wall biosynthesis